MGSNGMLALLKDTKFIRATALLVGTMVGVGIFGIPFAFAHAGFWIGTVWLVALAGVTMIFNLVFAELTLRTEGKHQISGYASIWLGPWARRAAFVALILSGYGTLLAYMIIAGQFLHNIFSHYIAVNPDWYSIFFALTWSLVVLVRLRTLAVVDLVLACLYGLTVGLMMAFGLPHVQVAHFTGSTPAFWFLPYGVLLFALSGANIIPIQRQLLAGRERLLKPSIITAVALVALLYFAFAFTIVGISGQATSPESIAGLYGVMGGGIIFLGSLFGVLTISSSFLMMGTALFESFHIDYRVKAVPAWLLVIVPPLVFFWSGLRNFIDVIGLVGSVAVGVLSLVVLGSYLKSRVFALRKPEFSLRLPVAVIWAMMVLFAGGIVYAMIFQ